MSITSKALSEAELLKEIYKKLAGESPALDLNKALSKAQLLRGIAEVAKPIPDPATLTVVEAIPTTLLPGQKVWCTATQSEWIGADPANGIFPTLDDGTPWPTKGYKAFVATILFEDPDAPESYVMTVIQDDIMIDSHDSANSFAVIIEFMELPNPINFINVLYSDTSGVYITNTEIIKDSSQAPDQIILRFKIYDKTNEEYVAGCGSIGFPIFVEFRVYP